MAVVTSVPTSALEFGNRIDAELYRPSLRQSFERIFQTGLPVTRLRRVCIIRSGTTPPDRVDGLTEGPILFKTTDIRNGVIPPQGDYYRITDDVHRRMAKTRLEDRDVLLNIVGATLDVIGRSAFVSRLGEEANITQAMVFLRCQTPDVLPGFLFAYLNTRYGQDQIARYARPTGQYNLNLQEVGHICIPLLPTHKQRAIEQLILSASALQDVSMASYAQAEKHFESELGLNTLTFQKPIGYAARFSTVGWSETISAGRVDAQCFAPDARFYESWLRAHTRCDRLGALLQSTSKGRQQVDADDGSTDYCSIKHINGRELVEVSKCFPQADTLLARPKDLLLAITGATIGKIGIVKRYEQLAFSGDLLCLRANESIDPHYLLLALDHKIGQVQFIRWITGSTNGHLAPRDVARVLVPRLSGEVEAKIADLVKDSLARRQESEQLLESAKKRVEQLIEEAVQP
ncbi:MAG: hypothetical protein KUL88_19720 [Rhizobium sp.]|nr:hypothetical protein [Rhizobium sp.]